MGEGEAKHAAGQGLDRKMPLAFFQEVNYYIYSFKRL